ncbi:MAG: hypothetical protein Q4G07_08815 [Oscillospiraceae bacterium]|nr:hypothetical protein [Oscillospiraceae bacterium]
MNDNDNERQEQPEPQLSDVKNKKHKKPKDPDHMKYPYLIYGVCFGLIIGIVIGYYIKNPLCWTLVGGAVGLIIGGAMQLFKRKN